MGMNVIHGCYSRRGVYDVNGGRSSKGTILQSYWDQSKRMKTDANSIIHTMESATNRGPIDKQDY